MHMHKHGHSSKTVPPNTTISCYPLLLSVQPTMKTTQQWYLLDQLVKTISWKSDNQFSSKSDNQMGLPTLSFACVSKSKWLNKLRWSLLSFKSKVNLEEGLRESCFSTIRTGLGFHLWGAKIWTIFFLFFRNILEWEYLKRLNTKLIHEK